MKLKIEEYHGSLKISNEYDQFIICLDVETGDIINWGNLGNLSCTIDELYRFVNKARSAYRKFLQSEEVESFKFD